MARQKRATDMALRSAAAPRKSTGPTVKLDAGLTPLHRVFAPTKAFDAARAESELRGQMASLVIGPARGIVGTMHGVLSGLVRVIQAHADAGEKSAAPEGAATPA